MHEKIRVNISQCLDSTYLSVAIMLSNKMDFSYCAIWDGFANQVTFTFCTLLMLRTFVNFAFSL